MWNPDMYLPLNMADPWAIIGPLNRFSPSGNLKLIYDRLGYMIGENPNEESIRHKDARKATALGNSDKWKEMCVFLPKCATHSGGMGGTLCSGMGGTLY